MQCSLDREFERRVAVFRIEWQSCPNLRDQLCVGDLHRSAGDVELVVDIFTARRVQRVATVAQEILPLRRRLTDEHPQATFGNVRAHWMDTRRTIGSKKSSGALS